MNELEIIKEQIRTINPEITDELLDLLYEFISHKIVEQSKSYLLISSWYFSIKVTIAFKDISTITSGIVFGSSSYCGHNSLYLSFAILWNSMELRHC